MGTLMFFFVQFSFYAICALTFVVYLYTCFFQNHFQLHDIVSGVAFDNLSLFQSSTIFHGSALDGGHGPMHPGSTLRMQVVFGFFGRSA